MILSVVIPIYVLPILNIQAKLQIGNVYYINAQLYILFRISDLISYIVPNDSYFTGLYVICTIVFPNKKGFLLNNTNK